jgi:hypothetical protein
MALEPFSFPLHSKSPLCPLPCLLDRRLAGWHAVGAGLDNQTTENFLPAADRTAVRCGSRARQSSTSPLHSPQILMLQHDHCRTPCAAAVNVCFVTCLENNVPNRRSIQEVPGSSQLLARFPQTESPVNTCRSDCPCAAGRQPIMWPGGVGPLSLPCTRAISS